MFFYRSDFVLLPLTLQSFVLLLLVLAGASNSLWRVLQLNTE